MENRKKPVWILAASLILLLTASCVSTGQYMPLSKTETVVSTVQTTFVVKSSLFSLSIAKNPVNTKAYDKLIEAAGQKFSDHIDIRDIEWFTFESLDPENTAISATGKVIRIE